MKRVQELARFLTPIRGDFFLVSGSAVANAKSLIGILSMDLDTPVEMRLMGCSPEDEERIMKKLKAEYDAKA